MTPIEQLHQAYCAETGNQPTLTVWERAYFDFLKHFTVEDLRLVCQFVKAKNRKMNGATYSVAPKKLFDFEYLHFDSLLSEAKAWNRNKPKPTTPQQSVLNALRPKIGDDLTTTATIAAAQTDIIKALTKT